MSKLRLFCALLFFAANFKTDVVCQSSENELGPSSEQEDQTVDRKVTGIIDVIERVTNKLEDVVSDLGGRFGDLITATKKAIPKKFLDQLSVYDAQGNHRPLTLEIPKTLAIEDPLEDVVYFTLYTQNANSGERLLFEDDSVVYSSFQPQQETVFIVHGWLDSNQSKSSVLLRDAYLKHGDLNVIVVDWSKISNGLYVFAANSVLKVATHVAEMIDFLWLHGLTPQKTRLTGHSLGAHIVGLAGFLSRARPNYVVGLDPAFPLFAGTDVKHRISGLSGNSVEIIHTNAGLLGFLSPLGHADFYPNGGTTQIGCGIDVACSHWRSFEFYAESLNNPNKFYANKCKKFLPILAMMDCKGPFAVMGTLREKLGIEAQGVYALQTNSDAPYARVVNLSE